MTTAGEVIAWADGTLTDEGMADLIHDLTDILQRRLRDKPREDSGVNRQIDAARIEVRSWPSSRQRQIKEYLGR